MLTKENSLIQSLITLAKHLELTNQRLKELNDLLEDSLEDQEDLDMDQQSLLDSSLEV